MGLAGSPTRGFFRVAPLAVFLMCLSTEANADVVLPVAAATPLILLIMLVPAIVLEAIVIWLWLDVSILSAIGVSIASNLGSTLVGIPVALFAAAASSGIVQATVERLRIGKVSSTVEPISGGTLSGRVSVWSNYDKSTYFKSVPIEEEWLGWATEAVVYLTVIAAFFVSWFVEFFFVRLFYDDLPNVIISEAVFRANLLSYAIVIVFLVYSTLKDYRKYRSEKAMMRRRWKAPAKQGDTHVPKSGRQKGEP